MTHRFLIIFGLAIALLAISSAALAFTPFGSTAPAGSPQNGVSLANNKWHYVWDANVYAGLQSDLRWSRDNVYGATDLDTYTGTSGTHDVAAYSNDYGDNNAVAWVNCPSGATTSGTHPNRTCYGQTMYFNEYIDYADFYNTQARRRFVTCHELGHTIGLRHQMSFTSCLNTRGTPLAINYISSHEEASHVNPQY